ncbi:MULTISPECIES: ABC transporter permease [Caballeronia]|uniref:ABC transporter permease n=1 Tax=Caballeronia jiangsuensis TaxID=1458357 RepID=A0ABW9CBK2_9BURK|nr:MULTISPECIES: ABC transporter permease [Caballeronia]GJH12652.1 ABC transporter permease [Caballeronia novacaledonica]
MSTLQTPATMSRLGRMTWLLDLTLFLVLILLWVALSVATRNFLTEENITNLMRQVSFWAIIAIGQTFVMITAGIDLSVGAVVGLSSVVVSMLIKSGMPISAAIVLTLMIGVVIGAFHGFCTTKLGLPPFITTLATLTSLRGFTLLITRGEPVAGLPMAFTSFARGSFLGVPTLFWTVLVVAVPGYFLLHRSKWGRYLFAVGSNKEAVRLSGVNVTLVIYVAYIVSAVCAALVGILVASRLSIGMATTGEGWELQSIASAVIGGASLFGAVGNIQGPIIGAALLTTLSQGANLLNIDPFWQRIVTGMLIIGIVFLDQMRRKGR